MKRQPWWTKTWTFVEFTKTGHRATNKHYDQFPEMRRQAQNWTLSENSMKRFTPQIGEREVQGSVSGCQRMRLACWCYVRPACWPNITQLAASSSDILRHYPGLLFLPLRQWLQFQLGQIFRLGLVSQVRFSSLGQVQFCRLGLVSQVRFTQKQ